MRRIAWLVLLVSGSACGDDGAPPPRGVAGRGAAEVQSAPPTPIAPSPRRPSTPREPIAVDPPPPIVERETVVIEREPERDLGAELHAAFGDPESCFGDLPPQIRMVTIDLVCTVHDDGVTSRCSPSASFRTEESDACLRRRASGLTLRPGVPEAPRSVATRLELRR